MSHQARETAAAPTPSGRGRRCLILSLIVAALIYGADQFTKLWVVAELPLGQQFPVIPGQLWWQHIRNSGAAFSLGSDFTWIFTVVMAVVVVFIVLTLRKVRHPFWAVGLGLVLGGAAGNLTDRLFREPSFGQGHVVDFIAVPNFAIFNLADCGVVVGIGVIMILILGDRDMTQPAGHRGVGAETPEPAELETEGPAPKNE
ncbi:signal peptidase II [Kocuria atrinae]|uniref:signal peptidase II n=1 Tax=Kocuria atrinae TaxID=592377 RepID=UPI0002F140FA|nr:signal peptidase II [Kocuria atrinae]